jgi:prepilin-type N-terminal cleavage/methylation domain-containing protein
MMKHQLFKKQAGFTLIELLIAASLSVVLMLIATYGLSIIVQANQKGEAKSLSRNNLNRAIDFISDEIKTAKKVSSTATWGWAELGGGSPQAKLYLEIPLTATSIKGSNDSIQVTNHEFYDGSAVIFSSTDPTAFSKSGLASNTVYEVKCITPKKCTSNPNDFQIMKDGIVVPLNDFVGNLTVNRLVIYYMRDVTPPSQWLKPKTINRSTGPCVGKGNPNCPVLVDSIAKKDKDTSSKDGLNVEISGSRKVKINITSQLTDDNPPLANDLEKVTAEVFARSATP